MFDNKTPETILKALAEYRESQKAKWRTNATKMRKWSTDEFIAFAATNAVNLQLLSPILEKEQTAHNVAAQQKADIEAHNRKCTEHLDAVRAEFFNKIKCKGVICEGDILPDHVFAGNIGNYKKISESDLTWTMHDNYGFIALDTVKKQTVKTLRLRGLHIDSDTNTTYAVLDRHAHDKRHNAERTLSNEELKHIVSNTYISHLQCITYCKRDININDMYLRGTWKYTPIESYTSADELIQFIGGGRARRLVFGYYLQDADYKWHFVQAGEVLESSDLRRKGAALFEYIKSIHVTTYPAEFVLVKPTRNTRASSPPPARPPSQPFASAAMLKKWCDILEVTLVERFNKELVKANYKRLALKWHPDRNMDDIATAKMQALNEAYNRIIND
jgi:hypothetical protein